MRRAWRQIAVFAMLTGGGFILGVAARSITWPRIWKVRTAPPGPKLPALYDSKSGQFKLLDEYDRALPCVVYLGDSITDWAAVAEWLQFEGGRALNRAISGDTTAGVLKRLAHGFPRGVEVCVLMIGCNDLNQGASAESTAARIETICDHLTSERRVGHVVLESVLPAARLDNSQVVELNARLKSIAERKQNASFLNLFPHFRQQGALRAELYADDTHLNDRGILLRLRLEVDHIRSVRPELAHRISILPVARP